MWKRANRYGASAAIITAFCTYYLLNLLGTGKIMLVYEWQPAPFGWSMLIGFGLYWLISILTRPEDEQRIELFFDRMRRKSDALDSGPGRQKPLASETGDDLLLLDIPAWRKKERWNNFFKRYREDLVGFILSWVFVGLIILLAWAILKIG